MMETVLITAVETVCALGMTTGQCLNSLKGGRGAVVRGETQREGFCDLPAGLLPERRVLAGRRHGAASNAAVHVARSAVEMAAWTMDEKAAAWLFAGSSRGNCGEIVGANGWRRPLRQFSASNSMHSEIAAAVSIDLGMRGPWQMLSNGCSSGLDALGMAWLAVGSGLAPLAVVVAVDLPMVPQLLRAFRETGLLSSNGVNDPFAISGPAATSGFLPGEAAVALTLERAGTSSRRPMCRMERYFANSDAYDSLMIPEDGGGIADCVRSMLGADDADKVVALCPHATGTANHARVEPRAIQRALGGLAVPLIPLKPHTGHTLGASGLLDVALLAACMQEGWLPAVLPGLTPPDCGLLLNTSTLHVKPGDRVIKLASGMGGHNAAVSLAAV